MQKCVQNAHEPVSHSYIILEDKTNKHTEKHRVYTEDAVEHRVYTEDVVEHRVYTEDAVEHRIYTEDAVEHRVLH